MSKTVRTRRMFAVVNIDDASIGIIGGSIFHTRRESIAYAERVRGEPWRQVKRDGFRVRPVRVFEDTADMAGLLGELRNARKICGRAVSTPICAVILDEIIETLSGGRK